MQNSNKTTDRMPRDLFHAGREKYGSIQNRLQARMVARAAVFARSGGRDYGYIGDEGRVIELLALALAALGDRSAVDELGIQY